MKFRGSLFSAILFCACFFGIHTSFADTSQDNLFEEEKIVFGSESHEARTHRETLVQILLRSREAVKNFNEMLVDVWVDVRQGYKSFKEFPKMIYEREKELNEVLRES